MTFNPYFERLMKSLNEEDSKSHRLEIGQMDVGEEKGLVRYYFHSPCKTKPAQK